MKINNSGKSCLIAIIPEYILVHSEVKLQIVFSVALVECLISRYSKFLRYFYLDVLSPISIENFPKASPGRDTPPMNTLSL